MDDKIKDAMHQAYTGESKAALRLKVFAEKAEHVIRVEKENNVSRVSIEG